MDLNAHLHTPLQASLRSTLIELFWYALMASAVWLLLGVAFRAAFRHRRVSRGDPTARQVGREIAHSLRSITIFGLATLAMVGAARLGWTRLYYRVGDYGWTWFVLRRPASEHPPRGDLSRTEVAVEHLALSRRVSTWPPRLRCMRS